MQRITRALILKQYAEDSELAVGPASLPLLQPNQVLVRMEYASVSVQDLSFMQGRCPVVRTLPAVPGFEGSGTVVETGSKLKNWRFQGKRVAVFAVDSGQQGTWAEYAVVHSRNCFPLPDSLSFEQGSALFLRPLTICMFEEAIRHHSARGIIQTSGASCVAKLMLKMCNYYNLHCICVISQPEEATPLAELGAKYILLSSDPMFNEKATELCKELAVSVAFDCHGGAVAGHVLSALIPGGVLYTYEDELTYNELTEIPAKAMIFQRKKVVGLNLLPWFERKHSLQKLQLVNRIQQHFFMYLPEVIGVFPMHEVLSAVQTARMDGRRGNILLQLRTLPTISKSLEVHMPGLSQNTLLEEEKHVETQDLQEETKAPVAIEAPDIHSHPAISSIESVDPKSSSKTAIALEALSDDEDIEVVEQSS